MRFAEPAWLLWLAGVPALGVLAWLVAVRRRRALALFAGGSAHLASFVSRVSVHRRAVKALLLLLAAAAGIAALARPQWGMRVEPISHRGVDVVLVLDTSLSMAAPDVPPDRLALARQSARALVGKLAGDRLALVTFAGRATLVCPLTPDTAAVQLFLDTVDVTSVSAPGSALAEALRAALSAFGERPAPGSERGRAVVLLSDGEDHEGGIEEVLKELAAADVAVFTVGCGTSGGAPIPIGAGAFQKDREGKVVTTRLDETVLQQIAIETGGRYVRATPAAAETEALTEALGAMTGQEYGTVLRARYEERFQIPLGIAFLALVADALLSDRRRR